MKKILVFMMAAVMMMSLVSCKSAQESSTEAEKVLKVHLPSTVDTVDPQLAIYDTSYEVIGSMLEGLLRISDNKDIAYGVADSYEVSDDGLTYTFKLKETTWSNGDPVTASDFVFGWLRGLNSETGSEYEYLLGDYIKNGDEYFNGKCSAEEVGIKAVDDYTLSVELKEPCAYFLSLLYLPIYYPVNEKFFNECGDLYATDAEHMLYNGPFKLSTYTTKAASFELVKNDKYWDKDNVKIDKIKYQIIEDTQQAMFAYENNELDIVTLSGEQCKLYKDNEELHSYPTSVQWFLRPNIGKVEKLQNLNLRKAISCCLNKQEIVDNILQNNSIAADFFVPEGLALDENGKDFQDMDPKCAGVNEQEALSYWEQAKAELGVDKLEIELLYSSLDSTIKIATYLKEEIEKILPDITINLRALPRESCVDALMSGDYELGLTCWGADYNDPATFLTVMMTGNVCNCGGWTNEKFDQLLLDTKTAEAVKNPAKRYQQLSDAEDCLLDDVALFPLYQQSKDILIKSNVKGVQYSSVAINLLYKSVTIE